MPLTLVLGQNHKEIRAFLYKMHGFHVAPQVGLEPTTLRLTAECSAIELLRNICAHLNAMFILLKDRIICKTE